MESSIQSFIYSGTRSILPVGEVPIPVGMWKLQGDMQSGGDNMIIGARGVAESFNFPTMKKEYKSGMSLEVAGGIRIELQTLIY